jgi:hypothetical protein
MIAIVAGVALLFLAPALVAGPTSLASFVAVAEADEGAQAARAAAKAWDPPRTPDGQPDIQGFWNEADGGADPVNVETGFQTASSLRIQQNLTDAQLAARKAFSSIIDPPDGKVPYQPWAEARRQQILSRYGGDVHVEEPKTIRDVSSELRCVLGVPRIVYFAEFQVTQAPGYVVMYWERTRSWRVIPLDGRPHAPANIKLAMGDARGKWEGNTLVVDTTNVNDWDWLDSKGTLHSDAMTLAERYTFVDANTLSYRVTVTDPKVFTRPWTMEWTLHREHAQDKNYEVMENSCIEGERAFEAIFGGAHR